MLVCVQVFFFGEMAMPKGMTPKARMDERLSAARERESRISGKDLYDREVDRFSKEDEANLSFVDRAGRAAVNMMANARRRQLERQNAPELSRLRDQISEIQNNRDIAAKQGTKRFRDGGKVKKSFPDLNKDGKVTRADVLKGRGVEGFRDGGKVRGCKAGQMSGKNFRGTY